MRGDFSPWAHREYLDIPGIGSIRRSGRRARKWSRLRLRRHKKYDFLFWAAGSRGLRRPSARARAIMKRPAQSEAVTGGRDMTTRRSAIASILILLTAPALAQQIEGKADFKNCSDGSLDRALTAGVTL